MSKREPTLKSLAAYYVIEEHGPDVDESIAAVDNLLEALPGPALGEVYVERTFWMNKATDEICERGEPLGLVVIARHDEATYPTALITMSAAHALLVATEGVRYENDPPVSIANEFDIFRPEPGRT